MKLTKILPVMAMVALCAFSCSKEESSESANDSIVLENVPASKTIEIEISELINQYRISIGLNPLNSLNVIKSVAYTHTEYMVSINRMNHDNFEQRRRSLIDNAGAITVSENVAFGYTTAEGVVNAWLNSPTHRAIIEGNYTDFDISAEQNSTGVWFFTNIFIKK